MVLAVGLLLLASLVLSAALTAAARHLPGAGSPALWQAVNLAATLAVVTLLFALVFKVLPDAPVAWGDVWAGAALTAVLFTLGRYLIGLYLGTSGLGSTYGAAGSLAAPVIPFAGDQAVSQQAAQQAIVPAARVVFLVVVEHAANVVGVVEEVDERRPDAGAEHIAEPLARPKLIAERVAQEFLEAAIRERNPLRNPRSRRHAHALRLSRPTTGFTCRGGPGSSNPGKA